MDDQRPAGKRRIRFSIRDLFWLILVIVMAAEWSLDHRRLASKADLVEPLQEKLQSAQDVSLEYRKLLKIHDESNRTLSKENANLYNRLYWIRQRDPKLVEQAEKEVTALP